MSGFTRGALYKKPDFALPLFSLATRKVAQIATLEKRLLQTGAAAFAVSPDGRWILLGEADGEEK